MTTPDIPMPYRNTFSTKHGRSENIERIKEAEITIDNKKGAPKNHKSLSNAALNGDTFQVNGKNIDTNPDSPAKVSNHCIGERFIVVSITTRNIA
jgi:hypothetical protein